MFLNMFYSANSCSHSVVSNAPTKVTKKSKHTNNNQNITTNSKKSLLSVLYLGTTKPYFCHITINTS